MSISREATWPFSGRTMEESEAPKESKDPKDLPTHPSSYSSSSSSSSWSKTHKKFYYILCQGLKDFPGVEWIRKESKGFKDKKAPKDPPTIPPTYNPPLPLLEAKRPCRENSEGGMVWQEQKGQGRNHRGQRKRPKKKHFPWAKTKE